ncbi:MAG TPA: DinB family protein [Candidatus Acidoferrales bacterium]|nr:DinB family protein [Candidatus Acidoferrales bacterium]
MRNLAPVLAHLEKTRAELLSAAGSVSGDRWNQAPGRGGWSAAEIAAHLAIVERAIIARAEELVKREPEPTPLLKRFHRPVRLAQWRIFRRKTPIPLDPQLVSERPAALEHLAATRKATLEFIGANRLRDLSAYRYPHPFLGSFNVYDWLFFIGYHELRHAKQIRETVETFHA